METQDPFTFGVGLGMLALVVVAAGILLWWLLNVFWRASVRSYGYAVSTAKSTVRSAGNSVVGTFRWTGSKVVGLWKLVTSKRPNLKDLKQWAIEAYEAVDIPPQLRIEYKISKGNWPDDVTTVVDDAPVSMRYIVGGLFNTARKMSGYWYPPPYIKLIDIKSVQDAHAALDLLIAWIDNMKIKWHGPLARLVMRLLWRR